MNKISKRNFSFIIVYYIYIFFEALSQTEMSFPEIKYIKWLCMCCMLLRILTESKVKKRYVFWWCLFGALCFVIGWKSSDLLKVMSVCVFTYAATDVDSERLVKTALIAISSVLIMSMVLSYVGFIPFIVSSIGRRVRYNLGFKYTTFSSNFFLHAVAMWLFIKKGEVKKREIIGIIILNYAFYRLTDTRSTNIEILFIAAVIMISKITPVLAQSKLKKIYQVAFLAGCIISMFFQIFYNRSKAWMVMLNTALSYRLSLGNYAFNDYGFSILGQYVQWSSFDREASADYYYVDSSYMNIAIVYGIILLIILVIGFSLLMNEYIRNNNKNKCNALLLLAIHSTMNPQLFNLLYNPFLFVMLPYLIDCIANIGRNKHIKMYRRISNE